MAVSFTPFLILLVGFSIVTANLLILMVLYKTDALNFLNKYFFTSLTVADLMLGMAITPFSFWASIFDRWIYGEEFCRMEAYLATILWIASVYSLMWMSIDHYIAIRKPDRYETIMSPMKCICWVAFVWLAAFCFCFPGLFGDSGSMYYKQAYICIIDWNLQKAYIITSGLLIIVPPAIALIFANFIYIFTSNYEEKCIIYEKCTDSYSRPEHYFINFMIGIVFGITWVPWCFLQMYELALGKGTFTASPTIHFCFSWLALSNSFSKFIIYVILSHDFRVGLKTLYSRTSCAPNMLVL